MKKDLISDLQPPKVVYESIVNLNLPEELIKEDPFEECLEFNGFYHHAAYRTELEGSLIEFKKSQEEFLKQLDSMNKKLDAIALLTTSFYLVYNNFHAIHSEDSAQDIVFAYRSDTIFNFDQDLNEEIVPNDILYRWISPFVLIQKGIIERAILFLNNQKQEISVLSSDKNNYRSRQESELPSSLHTISNNNTIEILDIRQSALLYHLLLLHGAIRPMADMNLAKLVHHLTGYSEQNLRTKDGLGVIWDIIEGKRIHVEFKDDPNHNLKAIKSLLTDMISDIDSKMVKNK